MTDRKSVVLVTGAGGGIGGAIVRALASANHEILATDTNDTALGALAASVPLVCTTVCDLTNSSSIEKLISEANDAGVNAIVHSAGYGGPFVMLHDLSDEDWQTAFKVNVGSLFQLTKGLLPVLKQNGYGRIVAISSVQGNIGSRGSAAYVSSKHALNGLIKTIAVEYGGFGISANAIAPGYIRTPMGADDSKLDDYTRKVVNRTPTRSMGRAEEVANIVAFLLANESGYMNGSVVTFDGGISADVGIVDTI